VRTTIKFGNQQRSPQNHRSSTQVREWPCQFQRYLHHDPNNTGTPGRHGQLLLGTASGVSQDFLLVWPGLRTSRLASFIQDDWKVTSRLTLNIAFAMNHAAACRSARSVANYDLFTRKIAAGG
jgi:hypothetical protein